MLDSALDIKLVVELSESLLQHLVIKQCQVQRHSYNKIFVRMLTTRLEDTLDELH